jgi:DNA polymerase-3 subunit delta'
MSDGYLPDLPWHAATWQALQPLRARGVHAILLHGAAGIGKKSLAIDLARAALCESPRADKHACGQCAGCALTAAGSHPDLRIVVPDAMAQWRGSSADDEDEAGEGSAEDAETQEPAADAGNGSGKGKRISREIRIEQVRALADFVATSTHRGGHRVVMLAPAELLNGPSANSLLKMLEEPPPASLVVLATDAIDDVLPTIRSRCVLVRAQAPSRADALAWLKAQQVDDAEDLLAAAGGAPLGALALQSGAVLEPELRATLLDLLAKGSQLTPADIARSVPKTVPVAPALALFQRWGWDLLALSSVKAPSALRYHPRAAATLGRVAARCDSASVLAWLSRLSGYRASQEHPLNPRLVIESALLDYVAALADASPAPASARASAPASR